MVKWRHISVVAMRSPFCRSKRRTVCRYMVKICRVIRIKFNQLFKKMSVLSLSYWESDVYWSQNNKHLAELNPTKWRKTADMKKLRHCHPMYMTPAWILIILLQFAVKCRLCVWHLIIRSSLSVVHWLLSSLLTVYNAAAAAEDGCDACEFGVIVSSTPCDSILPVRRWTFVPSSRR